jgi:hypothetical protein
MTFENRVKRFMGVKFDKLPPEQKKKIRELSTYQSKTKQLYKNHFHEVYEELGIL